MPTPRRLALVAGAAVLLLAGCGDGTVRAGAAAVVGDERITTERLQEFVDRGLADPQAAAQLGSDKAAFQRQALTRLIRREVLERAAAEEGVDVTAGEVDAQLETFAQQAGDRQRLEQQAAQSGIAAEDLDPFVRDILLDQALGDELTSDVDVPREQLEALYQQQIGQFDQVRARHILVEEEAEAREILATVTADPDRFAEIAAESSTDTGSAEQGGDLGLAGRGQFVPEFERVVFSAPPGEPQLVQTQFGWHVVEVLERNTTTLSEATPQLRRAALQEERQTRVEERLREEAQELGVTVNPRFGQWSSETLAVEPLDDPNGVTTPAPDTGEGGEAPLGDEPLGDEPQPVEPDGGAGGGAEAPAEDEHGDDHGEGDVHSDEGAEAPVEGEAPASPPAG